ncbi:hypothetical protein [Cytobacillus gottheilii]|uniref:hypothetical protein n=1 Tax=Cytobacillus gottheilii TaxID=859144 RepID=UPI0009BC6E95|nr:hypothetical protein [Cytobacillus gottheilii]
MRANISDELLNAIDEKIFIDLEINALNSKLHKAEKEGNKGFAEHLNQIILKVINDRKNINEYLKKQGVKVFEPEHFYDREGEDPIFVDYRYYQRINGGYKEGVQRYWISGIKYKLKTRLNKHFAQVRK